MELEDGMLRRAWVGWLSDGSEMVAPKPRRAVAGLDGLAWGALAGGAHGQGDGRELAHGGLAAAWARASRALGGLVGLADGETAAGNASLGRGIPGRQGWGGAEPGPAEGQRATPVGTA